MPTLHSSAAGLLRFATRSSALALAQTQLAVEALRAAHPSLEASLVEVSTEGDRDRSSPLSVIGGRGVFVRAVEQALLEGRADVAMHSLKDVPTEPLPGLVLAAVLPRADVRDALVTREGVTLIALPSAARVGTSSRRRVLQLRAARPDLEAVELRGNVDTRLARVRDGSVDGALLAAAGLARLGRLGEASELLDPFEFVPAPGQGAIVLQCRADDTRTLDLLAGVDDAATHRATAAERAVLAVLGSGCTLPVGAYARATEGAPGALRLRAMIARDDDAAPHIEELERVVVTVEEATALGAEVGARLAGYAGITS